jgi:hypothetical protein
MIAECHLCDRNRELRESHIIPSFVYKWLKASSGTGHIRFGETPNLRTQDGYKAYLLCGECEGLFNSWETEFANSIFHPLNQGIASTFKYGPWMLRFAVSVSWRVLTFFMKEMDLSHFPPPLQEKATVAIAQWKRFLLGATPHPSRFEQHMLPLDRIKKFTHPETPPNINRYILRTVDIDTVHSGDKAAYVYSKMGRIVLVGFIEMPRPREWKGTKLHVKEGVLGSTHYILPSGFGDYFMNKAKRLITIQKSMSEKQRKTIDESYRRDSDRASSSETLKAMDYDVILFGDSAFSNEEE